MRKVYHNSLFRVEGEDYSNLIRALIDEGYIISISEKDEYGREGFGDRNGIYKNYYDNDKVVRKLGHIVSKHAWPGAAGAVVISWNKGLSDFLSKYKPVRK